MQNVDESQLYAQTLPDQNILQQIKKDYRRKRENKFVGGLESFGSEEGIVIDKEH